MTPYAMAYTNDPQEEPGKCENCGCSESDTVMQLVDDLPLCAACFAKDRADIRQLHSEIARIFMDAITRRTYTEQNGKKWEGYQAADTVRHLIQNALGFEEA